MIRNLNIKDNHKFKVCLGVSIILLIIIVCSSLTIGQYQITLLNTIKALGNIIFRTDLELPATSQKVIEQIRLPRTIAAFIVGSCLSVSGNTFQSTFNNKLVSPDVLGVSAGACVGAALAILMGMNSHIVSIVAFLFGIIAVSITLLLPKLFHNNSTLMLVLSGIIVGSFMNSSIGMIKFVADKDDKLAEITFWIMGKLSGITMDKIYVILPVYIISIIVVFLMSWKINVLSLGEEEAKTIGLNYRLYRFIIITVSTLLTAVSVSTCGNVGWIGLVIPHISRAVVGYNNCYSIPMSFMLGGTFMILVDVISRNITTSEIPLSIITGFIGTIIYAIVLINKGREIHE